MKPMPVLLVMLFALAPPLDAMELPRIFSDGMVLQRDRPIEVWGWAQAGERITVELAGHRRRVRADADGAWRVRLPALHGGGPHVMRIVATSGARVLTDVLVGDVWLASGQSNMEWPLARADDAEAAIAASTDTLIRHFKVPRAWSGTPETRIGGGAWVASSPEVAGTFSAVAHHVARELRASTGVPIGIIDSTWGGSRIEAWMEATSLGLDPEMLARDAAALRDADARALEETRRRLSVWSSAQTGDAGWEAVDFDDSDWVEIAVPGLWESAGWFGLDGVAWYRRRFTLTAEQAARDLRLGLGRIDDSDVAYVNGHRVGATTLQYNAPREYLVPATALRAGLNLIALRVTDTGGGGGIHGSAEELFLQPAGHARRALDGAWSFRTAQAGLVAADDGRNGMPTLLYNAMIHPLQPFAVRGVLWYQGESNAFSEQDARAYRRQFPALIRQWREAWRTPRLPFLWVQLASFGSGADVVAGGVVQHSPWATLRESQSSALSLPYTAQAVSIDIGDAGDIHPRNKREAGRRLALAARRVAYGEDVVHVGPGPARIRFEGDTAMVGFDGSGGAPMARDGGRTLRGFTLAGVDGVFHAAVARIEGDQVRVRSADVPRPRALRYAWSDDALDADLVNRAGLPAAPFRSEEVQESQ